MNQKAVKRYRREIKRYLNSAYKDMFLKVFEKGFWKRLEIAIVLIFRIGYEPKKKIEGIHAD